MKKILTNYLLIVSLTYLIIGFTGLYALRHFLVVFPLTNYDIYNTNSLLTNLLLFRIPSMVFGVLGIIGAYFIKKERVVGIKVWLFLSGIVAIIIIVNFFLLAQVYKNTDFAISGSFDALPFTVISVFWAITYFFSTWYIHSKTNKQPN